MIDTDILEHAHEAVLDLAVAALTTCDHDRQHGHSRCPTCQRLAGTVDWLAAYREVQRDVARLLRAADDLTNEAA